MKKRNIITTILAIVLIAIWSVYFSSHKGQNTSECGSYSQKEINMGNKLIKVDIADDDCKRSLGLSGRRSLKDDEGMLFIFDKVGNYGFWMKDMLFPIDIIWADADLNVVGIEKDALPSTYPEVFGQNY
ncbi:MAG: DUF192 domain-containing protein, partial [Candidatus Paceibacterota bacterium]